MFIPKIAYTATGTSLHLTNDRNRTLCGRDVFFTLVHHFDQATCRQCRNAHGLAVPNRDDYVAEWKGATS